VIAGGRELAGLEVVRLLRQRGQALKAGDIIVSVAGQPVPDPPALFALLGGDRIGRSTPVDVLRAGRRVSVTSRPGAWSPDCHEEHPRRARGLPGVRRRGRRPARGRAVRPGDRSRVLAKLDAWQDIKFGLLMHWGPYSQWGVVESWSICAEDEGWCKRSQEDYIEYKRRYEGLQKTFNPVAFDPAKWPAQRATPDEIRGLHHEAPRRLLDVRHEVHDYR